MVAIGIFMVVYMVLGALTIGVALREGEWLIALPGIGELVLAGWLLYLLVSHLR